MVADPARRTHHDMGAVLQGADLGADRRPATEGQHLDVVPVTGQPAQLSGHLGGQLPGGAEYQPLDREQPWLQPLDQADAECSGLATASPGLSDEVLPTEGDRQAQLLDRGHLCIAHGGQVLQLGRGQVKGGE